MIELWTLLYTFFKIGIFGFGGGYSMMSMIMVECGKYGVTPEQFADLTALHMVIPGPIAINAATYVGYLSSGFPGALAATVGVSMPSLILVPLVMRFMSKYRENTIMNGALSGIKPAAVGLVAYAAYNMASGVLLREGAELSGIFGDFFGAVSPILLAVFAITAVANIKFKINPILLTLLAGVVGAIAHGAI